MHVTFSDHVGHLLMNSNHVFSHFIPGRLLTEDILSIVVVAVLRAGALTGDIRVGLGENAARRRVEAVARALD